MWKMWPRLWSHLRYSAQSWRGSWRQTSSVEQLKPQSKVKRNVWIYGNLLWQTFKWGKFQHLMAARACPLWFNGARTVRKFQRANPNQSMITNHIVVPVLGLCYRGGYIINGFNKSTEATRSRSNRTACFAAQHFLIDKKMLRSWTPECKSVLNKGQELGHQ